MPARDIYVLGGRRTPIGALRGSLADVPPGDLAGTALRATVEQLGTLRAQQPVVVVGSAIGRGNIARYAALSAGLGQETSAWTVNAQCTSGLTAVRLAAEHLRSTGRPLAFAGGVDSCSQSDVLLGARTGDGLPRVAHAPNESGDPDMGPAADATASHLGIGRSEQDDVALRSYARASSARSTGVYGSLIAPVTTHTAEVAHDDLPKRVPVEARLRQYPPAFGPGGTVTAGNAAALADGAAMVAIGPAEYHRPFARILAWGVAAGDPRYPALAVVPAIEHALNDRGLTPADVGRWEVNEAFAVKVVAVARHFAIDPARLNPDGGAIAFGHPFGASGAVVLLHLVNGLRRSQARFGVAAIAGAGGIGEAVLLERFHAE